MSDQKSTADEFFPSQYRIKTPEKWWQKDINPTFSFVFLVAAMLVVFVMGALFMREYMKIWGEITQKEQEVLLIDDIEWMNKPEQDFRFEEIILP